MDSSREIQDQAGWDEHAAFMNRLADGGFIIAGGPVGNGEQTLHTVEAANPCVFGTGWSCMVMQAR